MLVNSLNIPSSNGKSSRELILSDSIAESSSSLRISTVNLNLSQLVMAVSQQRAHALRFLFQQDVALRRSYDYLLERPYIPRSKFNEVEHSFADYYAGKLKSSEYLRIKSTLEDSEAAVNEFIDDRNRNIPLIKAIIDQREVKLRLALQSLREDGSQHIIVETDGHGWNLGGVLGECMMVVNNLLNRVPTLSVTVLSPEKNLLAAGVNFSAEAHERLTIKLYSDADTNSKSNLTIKFYGDCKGFQSYTNKICFFQFGEVFSTLQAKDGDYVPDYLNAAVTNDLSHPAGTLMLDTSLSHARAERDTWSLEELASQRAKWRDAVLNEKQNNTLQRIAYSEGWNVDRAIWSLGYFQAAPAALRELRILRDVTRSGEISELLQAKQIVFHLRLGALAARGIDFQEIIADGFRIISDDGEIVSNSIAKTTIDKLPITLVLHQKIDYLEMKRCISQLAGCPVRDGNNCFWIDFPLWVTGTASWLEAVSSGAIYLHDNIDAWDKKMPQISELVKKQLILIDDNSDLNYEKISEIANSRAFEYLLGNHQHKKKYVDLEGWSREARNFSEAMFRLNSVDDVIIALAEACRERP